MTLSGILAFGATSALYAQDTDAPPQQQQGHRGRHGRMNPDAQLQHLTKALDLTPDQQSQIKPVLEARQQQMQALFENQSLSRDDRRAQMQQIRTDTDTKIEGFLNDQQKQKFEAMQSRMQERMRARQGAGENSSTSPQPQ
jgi:Spy/CpxP family protein refolding chaperone